MDELRTLRVNTWVLYGLALAAASLDMASRFLLDERGFPNSFFVVGAIAGGNAIWQVRGILERQAAELAELRKAAPRA